MTVSIPTTISLSPRRLMAKRYKRFLLSIITILPLLGYGTLVRGAELLLTVQEKEFVRSHPLIKLGVDATWKPYIIKNEDGTLSGFDQDMVDYINKVTGLNIEIVTGEWKDLVARAKKKCFT